MLLVQLLLYSWLIQIVFYIVNFFFLKWKIEMIFIYLFSLYMFLPIVIVYFGLYPSTPGGTCGTEIFSPFLTFSIFGNLGNLLIFSGAKILSLIVNKFGYGK